MDPYDVLGLDKNSSQEAIKQRYRQLIQTCHPDKVNNESDEVKKEAKQKYEQIQESYRILGDPEKRRLFDDTGYVEPDFNEITRSVSTVLRPLILSYLAKGEEIFTLDIIEEINNHCINQILAAKNKINDLKKKKQYLSRVIKKFKRKKNLKKDFLNDIFIGELNAIDSAINSQISVILIMTQVKSVINGYEFDFMKVIEGPLEFNKPEGRVSLGNIFELAGVQNPNGNR